MNKPIVSRRLNLPLVLVVLFGLLSACSNGSGSSADTASGGDGGGSTEAGKTVEITFWNPDIATAQPMYKKLVDAFMKEHPNIKVKLVNYPEDGYFEKLNTSFAANQGPDLWVGYYPNDEYSKGYIAPIDDLIERDGLDMNQYFQPITDLRTKGADGKRYGLPRDILMTVMVYNKDMFDKYNVPYPQPGWSFDDFVDTVKKLAHPEDNVYGTDITNGLMESPLPWNMGVDLLSDDGTQAAGYADSPAMIDYMTRFQQLAKEGDLLPAKFASTVSEDSTAFMQGLVGLAPGILWGMNALKQANFNWGVVPYPTGPGGQQFSWMDTVQWQMNAKSKHKEETWELMKFLSGEEASTIVASDMEWGMPIKKVWEDAGLADDPVLGMFYREKDKPSKEAVYLRNTETQAYMWSDDMNAQLDSLVNPLKGQDYADPATVMHTIAKALQDKLDAAAQK